MRSRTLKGEQDQYTEHLLCSTSAHLSFSSYCILGITNFTQRRTLTPFLGNQVLPALCLLYGCLCVRNTVSALGLKSHSENSDQLGTEACCMIYHLFPVACSSDEFHYASLCEFSPSFLLSFCFSDRLPGAQASTIFPQNPMFQALHSGEVSLR